MFYPQDLHAKKMFQKTLHLIKRVILTEAYMIYSQLHLSSKVWAGSKKEGKCLCYD